MWSYVKNHIDMACRHSGGAYRLRDIKEKLLSNSALLWLIYVDKKLTASGVTTINTWPSKSSLVVLCVGGKDFWKWGDRYSDVLRQYQRQLGLDSVMAYCRDGMAKWLARMGWRRIVTTMEIRDE